MKIRNTCPKKDIDYKDVHSKNDDERTEAEMLADVLMDVYEVSLDAQSHLHLFHTRPECGVLILGDYLKRIEVLCSI